jgi:F0F1-type ATP synthase assembly protein I
VADPSDRERRDPDEGLSSLAKGYRSSERYAGAAISLVAAVGGGAALGYWLDRKLGHEVPWLLLVGAAVGMVGGFISFFRTVLGKRQSK